MIFILIVSVPSTGYGANFQYIGKTPSSFFGRPFEVLEVQPTGKDFQDKLNKKIYYTYRVVLQRPGRDNGWGVARIGGVRMRLYYWAAADVASPFTALAKYKAFQDIHSVSDDKVIVNIQSGLPPGKRRIRIAIFPYPMLTKYYSLRDLLRYEPVEYARYVKDILENIAASSSPMAFLALMLLDKIEDLGVEGLLMGLAMEFGRIIEFEIPAVMPNIRFATPEDAAQRLKNCSLIPNPDYTNTILTNIKERGNRVAKVMYDFGDKLKAGTTVAYKFFEYTSIPQKNSSLNIYSSNYSPDADHAEIDFSGFSSEKCPKRNPGTKHNYSFPSNHNGNRVYCRYYNNGRLAQQVPYKNHKSEGWDIGYFPDGQLKSRTHRKNGCVDGPFEIYQIKNGIHYKYREGKNKNCHQVKGSVKRYPPP